MVIFSDQRWIIGWYVACLSTFVLSVPLKGLHLIELLALINRFYWVRLPKVVTEVRFLSHLNLSNLLSMIHMN